MKDTGLFQYSVMLIIILALYLDEMATFPPLSISSCSPRLPSSPNSSKREFAYCFSKAFENKMIFCVLHIWTWRIFLLLEFILYSRYCSIVHLLELYDRRVKCQDSAFFQWLESLKKAISRFVDLWEAERYILKNPHISSLYIRACPVLVLFYFVLLYGSLSKGWWRICPSRVLIYPARASTEQFCLPLCTDMGKGSMSAQVSLFMELGKVWIKNPKKH